MKPYCISLQDYRGIYVNLQISIVRRNLVIYFIFITLVVGACSYVGSPISASYHNLTAHYNAFFIANEHMKEIERTLYENYQWNYNKVLPIYVPVDTNDANSLESQIEDCIEKASIAIQRHPDSKWEDNSYLLVGKARYYARELADAIETFKYVNKHGEDDNTRHEALIELIKTFVDFNEINNAIAVSDYLKKEDLNNTNKRELALVRAYLYQQRKDYDNMIQHLVQAEELMSQYADKGRIDFIIGQVYQQLGFEAEAYNYYERCLKNGPEYELAFYTKLNMAQVTQLTSSGDIKRIQKYFRKLLKDPKNLEYKDKIYYEMANFEMKQGNLSEAIEYYKESVQSSVKNQRQKAYSYYKLGIIYYDSLKNFELAKSYYDSTVATMPQDEENFAAIKQRQSVLEEFVKNILIVRNNDSLIHMSQLPQDSLVALATAIAEEQESKAEAKRKREERRLANQQNTAFDINNGDLIGTTTAGAQWYFYNPNAIGRGASEFKRVWGDRPLEDNWRRSQKAGADISAVADGESLTATDQPEESKESRVQAQVEQMLTAIPSSDEEIEKLLAEVEVALYNLGNIYNFKLEEKENAATTFESLIVRFPETEYKAEVLYQLYLLYKKDQPNLAEEKAMQLKTNFPETIYAKLIDNPNYREESQAATEQLKITYKAAYELYEKGAYQESQYMLDSALRATPDNSFSDNIKLLSVLNTGKLEGQYKYQYELNNFIKTYPESDLVAYAKSLVQASEDYQINLYNSAKARFVEYFKQKHYLIVVYPNNDELSEQIPAQVEEFIMEKNFQFTTGNLILDETNAMVLINEFPGKGTAQNFLQMMESDLDLKNKHKGQKIYSFAITEDNFDIFYQTKDLNAYLNFFEKHYSK